MLSIPDCNLRMVGNPTRWMVQVDASFCEGALFVVDLQGSLKKKTT